MKNNILLLMLFIFSCKIDENKIVRFNSLKQKSEVFKQLKYSGDSKVIYFTIDDGVGKGTENILEVAQNTKTPINLFLVGEKLKKYRNEFDDVIRNPYVDVYNHSYSHAHDRYIKFYSNSKNVLEDFKKASSVMLLANNFIRLPGRNFGFNSNSKFRLDKLDSSYQSLILKKYIPFGWDIEWSYYIDYNDKLLENFEQIILSVDKYFKHNPSANKCIVLAHDAMFSNEINKNMLTNAIVGLKQKGYIFDWIINY